MLQMPKIPTSGIAIQPPVYFGKRAKSALTLDGKLDKPFWEDVPFSEDFLDISGPDFPVPRFRTRMKMCWDDENLYLGALLEGNDEYAGQRAQRVRSACSTVPGVFTEKVGSSGAVLCSVRLLRKEGPSGRCCPLEPLR